MADFDRESMLGMVIYEMSQLIESLEQSILSGEAGFSSADINEIFRVMHTIKGSAAMMMFDTISSTAHVIEDLFYYLREENPENVDYSTLADLVLEGVDFIKLELGKIESSLPTDGDSSDLIRRIKLFLKELKGEPVSKADALVSSATQTAKAAAPKAAAASGVHVYKALIRFEDGCEMENIRAYTLVHNLGDSVGDVSHVPADVIDEEAIDYIRKNGFILTFTSKLDYSAIESMLQNTVYLKSLALDEITGGDSVVDEIVQSEIATHGEMKSYKAIVRFSDGAEMENVRSYAVIRTIEDKMSNMSHLPADIIDEASALVIRKDGFVIMFDSDSSYDTLFETLTNASCVKEVVLEVVAKKAEQVQIVETESKKSKDFADNNAQVDGKKSSVQHVISVNVSKLDQLLNLMGELVIAEAMVIQNKELEGLELENFHKEARQLRKIIKDVQDTVMTMRMLPLSTTFFKMHRIVRDMCKQLNKDVQLEILGEETEVDKNVIEHISDPLMHIIRNSVDHGIEMPEARLKKGKPEKGKVLLEAKNTGGDVLIIIKDDGAGLNRDKILEKAKNNGLLKKPENEYTDKEIHQFIFLPGFSTNEAVTSYSGRGVGMDVVSTNLEIVSGSVLVDSVPGMGSTFTLKIPLTLAIIAGMTIKMGAAKYTIPIISIRSSFRVKKEDIYVDPSGNEMITTVRGEVFNVVRLYEFFNVDVDVHNIEDAIIIMLENGEQTICVMADELLGEQQVVVKTMPKYIKKLRGISGCTLLGNGDISLIIDVAGFFDK